MKSIKYKLEDKYASAKNFAEDLRFLQKSLRGKSVYKSRAAAYQRYPKHRHFAFED